MSGQMYTDLRFAERALTLYQPITHMPRHGLSINKPIGIYVVDLILGVLLQYTVSALFSCFLWLVKGSVSASLSTAILFVDGQLVKQEGGDVEFAFQSNSADTAYECILLESTAADNRPPLTPCMYSPVARV